jgi:hypothetical protein
MEHANQHTEKPDLRHADDLAALLRLVLESPAVTDPATRAAAYQSEELPPPLRRYVAKVHGESYRITDGEVQALLAAGYSPDAVFEIPSPPLLAPPGGNWKQAWAHCARRADHAPRHSRAWAQP